MYINLVLYSDVRYQRFIVFYLFTFHSVQYYLKKCFFYHCSLTCMHGIGLQHTHRMALKLFKYHKYNNLFNWLTEHHCLGVHPNLTVYIVSIVGWLNRLYKTGWYIHTRNIVVPVPNQDLDFLRHLSCSVAWWTKWLIVLLILVEFLNCLDSILDWGKWNSNRIW